MKTVEVSVDELVEMSAKYNPRKIEDRDLKALQGSIREWGFVEPVVVNKRSNTVVGGHQRIKAAKLEGIEKAPVVYVDLDDSSERSLNLALNRISGEWDDAMLLDVLSALSDDFVGLSGFTGGEVESLFSKIEYASAAEGSNDDTHLSLNPTEAGWADAGIRSVILPYDVEAHGKVLELMNNARKEFGVDNNSDLVMKLLSGA